MKHSSRRCTGDVPNVAGAAFDVPSLDRLEVAKPSTHKPRIGIACRYRRKPREGRLF